MKKALTLKELLIVILIITGIATYAIINLENKCNKKQTEITNVEKSIEKQ